MKRTLETLFLMQLCTGFFTPVLMANPYGLPNGIQEGNILHCFNWTPSQVKEELPGIAEAGYGSVQLSPFQRPDVKIGSTWHDLYRPYDLAFKSSEYATEEELKDLCAEADKYGIKVIVDVVANHVDGITGYHDTWWDSGERVRWEGGINYADRYSVTHGQLGDYGDVNSELFEVAYRCREYVEKLKEIGVSGIRWDAAKHIGLPSEGCYFWSVVTSVAGMYHYGEILDSPCGDDLINEYVTYMSVTDNRYCDAAAKENGGIPYGYGGAWVADQGCPENKMVYWGESHDTYSNSNGWSKYHDQGNIDRAYAALACRNGATALYLARPDQQDYNSIKVGKGNSTAYKSKHITEVNKFRNAMTGKADWFENSGNACSITRENGGAVVVAKTPGLVSVENGGSYCPAGVYRDRVSGNTFTVTANSIIGTVGESCIAVLYSEDSEHQTSPDIVPDILPDPMPFDRGVYVYFDNSDGWATSAINVWAWNDGDNNCTNSSGWPGDVMVKLRDEIYKWTAPEGKIPTEIIITTDGGSRRAGGQLKYVNGRTYYSNGLSIMVMQENVQTDPDNTDPGSGTGQLGIPATLYVIGNIAGAVWDTTAGEPMDIIEPGVFISSDKIYFEAAHVTDPYAYFSLTEKLGSNWDELNNTSDRFGPLNNHLDISLNQWSSIKKFNRGSSASSCTSWRIRPGAYYVKADFNTGMLQLAAPTIVNTVGIDDDSETLYYTMQGVKVDNPSSGVYIMLKGRRATKVYIE